MNILAIDTSGPVCGVAILSDGAIRFSQTVLNRRTHSVNLMPMVDAAFSYTGLTLADMDRLACVVGPGSFTGVRIGVSAVKGMAYALDKPCVEVSTLESMAYNLLGSHTIVCACMDARRRQVYHGLFRVDGDTIERLCDDTAIAVDDLLSGLPKNEEIILVGDGAELVAKSADDPLITLAPPNVRYQRASSVALAAVEKYNRGEVVSPAALMPRYLRLSQAERERNAKINKEQDGAL